MERNNFDINKEINYVKDEMNFIVDVYNKNKTLIDKMVKWQQEIDKFMNDLDKHVHSLLQISCVEKEIKETKEKIRIYEEKHGVNNGKQ